MKIIKHISTFFLLSSMLGLLGGCAGLSASRPPVVEPSTGMEFVYIRGGNFDMGDATGMWSDSEHPVHTVKVAAFYAGKYEVTFDQYDRFCDATGREKPDDAGWGRGTRPVINVSWNDAVAFADWLSKKSGFSISLPSETQWEYMARGGTTTSYWAGKTLPKSTVNCADCNTRWEDVTAPVGSFPANPYGLYDTAGNVAEWCLDGVHKNYDNAPTTGQAWDGGETARRIIRGGSWAHTKGDVRSAFRDWDKATVKDKRVGFRLVITPPLAEKK